MRLDIGLLLAGLLIGGAWVVANIAADWSATHLTGVPEPGFEQAAPLAPGPLHLELAVCRDRTDSMTVEVKRLRAEGAELRRQLARLVKP